MSESLAPVCGMCGRERTLGDSGPGPRMPVRHCKQCGQDFVTSKRRYSDGPCSACYLHPAEDGWTVYDEGPGLW